MQYSPRIDRQYKRVKRETEFIFITCFISLLDVQYRLASAVTKVKYNARKRIVANSNCVAESVVEEEIWIALHHMVVRD